MVTAVAYTNFRKDLKSYLRRVNDDADMLLITNKDPRDNVVVMSADDYDSLMETLRLFTRIPGCSIKSAVAWHRYAQVPPIHMIWSESDNAALD